MPVGRWAWRLAAPRWFPHDRVAANAGRKKSRARFVLSSAGSGLCAAMPAGVRGCHTIWCHSCLVPAILATCLFGGGCHVWLRTKANRCPQWVLVVLAPFSAEVVEGDLRRIAYQLGQGLDGAALAAVPVARQHPMGERVATTVAGIPPFHRISIPAQFPFQRQKTAHPGRLLPSPALGVAKERNS